MSSYFVVFKCGVKHKTSSEMEAILESNLVIDFKDDILTTEDILEFEKVIIKHHFSDLSEKQLKRITLTITNFKKIK